MDIWNAKAPFGVEFEGKKSLEGLTLLFGPEVYWGANPKVMLKYSSRFAGLDYTFLHSEDVARSGDSASFTEATVRQSRATTLYVKKELGGATYELGGIMSATEKVDDEYSRYDNGNVIVDEIDFEDTLGIKGRTTFKLFDLVNVELAATYAGLVADGGAPLEEFGITGPVFGAHSGQGNKYEYEAAFKFNFGNHMIYPRFLYRDNLVDANPLIPAGGGFAGLAPRWDEIDPFAVGGNRETRAAEIVYTYDQTGGTYFYDWNNDEKEDAGLAFNVVASYTEYPTATDATSYFNQDFDVNAFFAPLPAEDVWHVSSKIVINPSRNLKMITNLLAGYQQSTGDPTGGTRKFYEADAKFIINKKHILSGYVKKDAWGPYDFQRQFNITFPRQYKLDYAYLLDQRKEEDDSSRIGVRALYRTYDKVDNDDDFGTFGDYRFMTIFYFDYNFK